MLYTRPAVDTWLRAARVAHESGAAAALRILRDRIAALDEASARRLDGLIATASATDLGEGEDEFLDIPDSVTANGDTARASDASDFPLDLDEELKLYRVGFRH